MSVACVKIEKKRIVLGADSIVVSGRTQDKDKNVKIRKVNDVCGFACSGLVRETEFFYLYAKDKKPKYNNEDGIIDYFYDFSKFVDDKIGEKEIENSYIFVYDKKVWYFDKYFLKEIINFEAIGAGMEYAKTALFLGHSVEESVKVACELSVYCELPCNVFTFSL